MSKWPWILGGIFGGGVVLLLSSEAQAAPAKRAVAITHDEDALNDALRRLTNFIAAANINAHAYKLNAGTGLALGVQPGGRFVAEDAAALPRDVSGISVVIKGWPR